MGSKKKERKKELPAQPVETVATPAPAEEIPEAGVEEQVTIASARDMSRSTTTLAFPPRKPVGEVKVTLLASPDLVPTLDEVLRINKGEREARTPLMTVIQAVLSGKGGSMKVSELTAKVRECWNRPFPGSPYSGEELIYVMVHNSGDITVAD